MQTIYFDMDGTIADLYGVDDWLSKLIGEDESPYVDAKPMEDMGRLQNILSSLQKGGCKIGVVSWLSKDSTPEYDAKVKEAKMAWLKEQMPQIMFDEVHIVPYGTAKHGVVSDDSGLLFDDDERVRSTWQGDSIDPAKGGIVNYLDGKIYVKPHTRKGKPVRGHFRKKAKR